ncbi:alpha-ribazole phosphatase [Andreprevotia lacus DSM 23236]|jgi:alpha-ribazole phosphatase|uniref:Alpha-ribazole phosphatase n=1 Tax=Andreprevotia lacus DSM 23236 TaxID=1121001 RepID=A0A1W1XRR8_9NEIS|nr:histidine phosphatase family protein [Andreprevotia lacus]SMC26587.1 alpha-ribazole phosphatase [Andreprevotia lacus DSM 23236]
MALYLIRHFPPRIAAGVCYGRLDIPLLDPADASPLRAQLPAQFICHSSPLQRCRLLAEALTPRPVIDPRLQEMDFGRWEGLRWDDIGPATLDHWIASGYDAVHGGESLRQLQQRAYEWAGEAASTGGDVVALTHSGVIRVLLAARYGWQVEQMLSHSVPCGSVTILDWRAR